MTHPRPLPRRVDFRRFACLPNPRAAILVAGLLAAFLSPLTFAQDKLISFDIPAGNAISALQQFSTQSGQQLLYSNEEVSGVNTNRVKGRLTVQEALDQLLVNTPLVSLRDDRNGAVAVGRKPDPKGARAAPVVKADDRSARSTETGEENPVELSPFVISASSETGWVVTETLAGSRLRTNLKDVPNQIETLTKDFMMDLALTSPDQALVYTANVENINNDYVPVDLQTVINKPTTAGRIRGVATGTLSRNFFQTSYPSDNFNVERLTVASGPNAILFGLGSPAGIFDATPARALMRNKYSFEAQFDSENSKRATFDANTMIIPEKLSLRVMGLSKREYTDKKPNLDRDDRVYGALTFSPFKSTSIILQGEKSNRNWNRANRYPPNDRISPWLRANLIPNSGYTVSKPVFNNNTGLSTIGSNVIFTQSGDVPVLVDGGTGKMQNWQNSVVVKHSRQMPGVDPIDANVSWSLMDPSIYPFDVNYLGTSRATALKDYTRTVIIEQKLTRNLFLEAAYNSENYYYTKITGGSESLMVDANQFLPNTTIPNPNLGKLFTEGQADNEVGVEKRRDWRIALSYELDLGQKYSDRGALGKWLGRHRLFALYAETQTDIKGQGGFAFRILDDPVISGLTLRSKTSQNWATHGTRIPQFRHYFDNPNDTPGAQGPMAGEWSLVDASGTSYKLYRYDTPLRAADGKRLGSQNVANGSLNETSGQIAAWQGFFLPDRENLDRLVLTFGYRKDRGKASTLDLPSVTRDFSGLYPILWDTDYASFGPTQSGINRSFGVVARPLKWLSVFYNKSTTFDLNLGLYDPYGNDIPGSGGDGKDYGVRFDLLEDKLALRINKYETTAGPTMASIEISRFRNAFRDIENRARALDPLLPTINVANGNRRGFEAAGGNAYMIASDVVAKGYEVELHLQPTRNWNLRLNGAKTEATESDIGLPWIAWAEARFPTWQALVAKNGEVDSTGKPVTWKTAPFSATNPTGETIEQRYTTAVNGNAIAYMKAANGRANNAHPLRANLISNYRFSEGRLNGLNVGGAVRWRDASTIGYGTMPSPTGSTLLNLDKAYEGERETYVDAFVGYRGRIKAFGGLGYRVQVNIRNLLDEDNPIPVATDVKGNVVRIATVDPRLMVFTFGVDF